MSIYMHVKLKSKKLSKFRTQTSQTLYNFQQAYWSQGGKWETIFTDNIWVVYYRFYSQTSSMTAEGSTEKLKLFFNYQSKE
jgi:hypothetical protein